MIKRFYLDTAIWIDLYEDRKGYNGEHLGKFAWKLMSMISENQDRIIITEMLLIELNVMYSIEKIKSMFKPFEKIIDNLKITKKQHDEAEDTASKRNLPKGDVLHAIIARDNGLILVTRDKHFRMLKDISKHHKPEDLI